MNKIKVGNRLRERKRDASEEGRETIADVDGLPWPWKRRIGRRGVVGPG